MTSKSFESGIQPDRLEFVRETSRGVTPSNPSWILYSDTARTFDDSIDPQIEAQENLGDPDYAGSFAGTEQSEMTVVYDLQQWLIDGSGNAQDASYDGASRNSDNRLANSHSVVRRMDLAGIAAGNTINGSTSYDTRLYFVGKGGLIDQCTFTANIDSGQPIQPELAYMFEKSRRYQIDQPDSSTLLAVESTDSGDTTQTLTIEDEGASTTEDVSLNGTTLVGTSSTFGDIDALSLDAETVGDVNVYINTGTTASPTAGDQLAVLYGQLSYDQGEGDLGVPALGTGSHASALGSSYELPLDGDAFELPSGTTIADEITSVEMAFSNNVSGRATDDGPRPTLSEAGRDAEVSVTVFGETETYQHTVDMLRNVDNDFVWTASDPSGDSGSITLGNTDVTSVGRAEEAREDVVEIDLTVGNQESVTIA